MRSGRTRSISARTASGSSELRGVRDKFGSRRRAAGLFKHLHRFCGEDVWLALRDAVNEIGVVVVSGQRRVLLIVFDRSDRGKARAAAKVGVGIDGGGMVG